MIFSVIMDGISKAGRVLLVLMKVYPFPCPERGYVNVMLVLQSCSDPLHILPGSSSETNATSDGVCSFSSIDYIDVIEENFVSINEDMDRGIKQEEIPGDINFPEIKSEPAEVSYICICLLLDTFYQCPGISVFLMMSLFLANWNSSTFGNKIILLVYRL